MTATGLHILTGVFILFAVVCTICTMILNRRAERIRKSTRDRFTR